jgi:hypothetical protein
MFVGVCLVACASLVSLGPIALVCGLLLVWSGIVKIIVLRIWHKTLTNPLHPDQRVARDHLARPPSMP